MGVVETTMVTREQRPAQSAVAARRVLRGGGGPSPKR
jgi:hypothetical protein